MSEVAAVSPSPTAGLGIQEWARAAGIAYSTYYIIPAHLKPRHVKIGRKVIVLERPIDWLERVAKLGGVPPRSKAVEASA